MKNAVIDILSDSLVIIYIGIYVQTCVTCSVYHKYILIKRLMTLSDTIFINIRSLIKHTCALRISLTDINLEILNFLLSIHILEVIIRCREGYMRWAANPSIIIIANWLKLESCKFIWIISYTKIRNPVFTS